MRFASGITFRIIWLAWPEPREGVARFTVNQYSKTMRRHTIQTTLICLMIASVAIIAPLADAGRPAVYVVGENGYFGLDSDGDIHYVLTSDGFRLYDVPTYGYCGRHHRHHSCRYVYPKYYKHYDKHHKKQYKRWRKEQKKYYKEQKKYYKHHDKYYKKHGKRHHHGHDD